MKAVALGILSTVNTCFACIMQSCVNLNPIFVFLASLVVIIVSQVTVFFCLAKFFKLFLQHQYVKEMVN